MKRSFFSFLSIGLLAAGLFFAVPSAMLAQSAKVEDIYAQITRNSNIETQFSKMALKSSDNADVKKFAKKVISDNRGMAGQVFSYAVAEGFTLTTDMPSSAMEAEKQMQQLTGVPFDKVYLVQMDAFVKDDKVVAAKASAMTKEPGVGEIGDELQALAAHRTKDISKLTDGEGFKIQ